MKLIKFFRCQLNVKCPLVYGRYLRYIVPRFSADPHRFWFIFVDFPSTALGFYGPQYSLLLFFLF